MNALIINNIYGENMVNKVSIAKKRLFFFYVSLVDSFRFCRSVETFSRVEAIDNQQNND